jgi:hypothetical protein
MSVAAAIKVLRTKYPDKWKDYDDRDLEKRYYEAKNVWTESRRLRMFLVEKP